MAEFKIAEKEKYIDDFLTTAPNAKKINKHDEIETYINARYISASEAVWRIIGFSLHNEFPKVFRLTIHLPNVQMVVFAKNNNLKKVLEKNTNTHLTAFLKLKFSFKKSC